MPHFTGAGIQKTCIDRLFFILPKFGVCVVFFFYMFSAQLRRVQALDPSLNNYASKVYHRLSKKHVYI